jgi:hypothetical protein
MVGELLRQANAVTHRTLDEQLVDGLAVELSERRREMPVNRRITRTRVGLGEMHPNAVEVRHRWATSGRS